ncbi:odorant receptor 131-2-like [Engystomops pustulosus]|uniref:odorant receptor 131-2-like n=1 Tax=Engystomops pustulosus TaxID=76066 RepID=UPI003AFB7B66
MASPDSSEPALICDEHRAQVLNLPILMFSGNQPLKGLPSLPYGLYFLVLHDTQQMTTPSINDEMKESLLPPSRMMLSPPFFAIEMVLGSLRFNTRVAAKQISMVNSTSVLGNITLVSSYTERVDAITRTIFVILSLLFFTFFVYIISILLKVFFTTPHVWEMSRYILFVHMLINDTLYLALGNFILVTIMYSVYFPVPVCYFIHTLATCSFRVTPYNLAVMSLERYIAICFPLKHIQFCTAARARSAIVVVWAVGFVPSIADIVVVIYSTKKTFYSLYVFCDRSMLIISPLQNVVRSFFNIFSFTMVALTIIFTYIKVMLVAKKIGSSGSSALKAGKTVMLHAFQLMLCMVSFISTLTETYLIDYVTFLLISNFVMFTCVPRLLSPIIYGVRDEVFRKYIRKLYAIKF